MPAAAAWMTRSFNTADDALTGFSAGFVAPCVTGGSCNVVPPKARADTGPGSYGGGGRDAASWAADARTASAAWVLDGGLLGARSAAAPPATDDVADVDDDDESM